MLIQYSKNNYDCLALAFAMVLDVELKDIIEELGCDGSEIIFPQLKEPMCRRGHHPQEFLKLAWVRGFNLISVEAKPVMAFDEGFKCTKELNNEAFLVTIAGCYNGVLCGETFDGRYHAVAWDKDKKICHHEPLKKITYFYALTERRK